MTNKKLSLMVLSGQLQRGDHQRSVVAICNLTSDLANSKWSAGTLTLDRWNGINNTVTIDVAMRADYDSNYTKARCDILVRGGQHFESIRPCTFTYNGIKYGGLELHEPAQHPDIAFYGLINEQNLPFGLDYYNQQTGAILNQEVYNSINFENIVYGGMFSFNGKNILTYGDTAEWHNLTLINGYQSLGIVTPQYGKSGDIVHVRGSIVHSTGISNHGDYIAVLPVGYRPSKSEYFNVPLFGAGVATLVILPDSTMLLYNPSQQDTFNAGIFFSVSFRL